MRRRDFVTLVGGAAAGWPFVARAQERPTPVIGLLNFVSFESYSDRVAILREGLRDAGFIEGHNLVIEYRSADGHAERLPDLVSDLVRRKVSVLVTIGGDLPTLAAKAATATIPIVFATGGDPVLTGLVSSLSRPEANITGVSFSSELLDGKRLGLLHELLPQARSIAFLTSLNPTAAARASELTSAAARALGIEVATFDVKNEQEIDAAFDSMMRQGIGGLVVENDAYLNSRKDQIIALAARHRVPAVYAYREHTLAGGLMSYGTDVNEMYRPAGVYAGRILKGVKPADLPILQPTNFLLIINLKTAKALGLDVPLFLQQRADEVIE